MSLDALTFLRFVSGEVCPCGHPADEHLPATDEIPGEQFGACSKCDCAGVIDFTEDD